MSTTRAIAHNTAIQFVGKILSTILGLLAVAIMTRSLGPERFGWFITTTAFLQFVAILTDFGFTLVSSSMLAKKMFPERELLSSLFSWRLVTGLFFHGVAVASIWLFPYSVEIKIAVAINSISSLASTVNQVFIGYYQTKLRMIVATVGEVLGRMLLVVGVTLVWLKGAQFLPMVIAATIPAVINVMYLAANTSGFTFNFNKQIGVAIFKRTWPTATTILFNAMYAQGDRVILPLYVSQSEVGLYGAAYRILDLVLQTSAIITGIIFPLLVSSWTEKNTLDFKKYYQMLLNGLALFLFPTLLGIYVLATPIMHFLYGSEFTSAGSLLRWLVLAIFGYAIAMTFGHLALAIDRQKQAIAVYFTTALLSVIGYFVFIPAYGVFAAAGVTVFSEVFVGVGLASLVVYYSRFIPDVTIVAKIFIASTIMAYTVHRLQPLSLTVSILFGVGIYSLLVVGFRVTPISLLRDILRRNEIAEKS